MRKLFLINARALGDRRGFTAIEVFGALVIALILSTMAIASFQLVEKDLPLDSTAQKINHAAATARARAISRNTICSLQFDIQSNNYWIDETDEGGVPTLAKVIRPEPIHEHVILERITYGGNSYDPNLNRVRFIRFFPDGTSDDVKIYLRDAFHDIDPTTQWRTVRVYGPTGHSKIFDTELP